MDLNAIWHTAQKGCCVMESQLSAWVSSTIGAGADAGDVGAVAASVDTVAAAAAAAVATAAAAADAAAPGVLLPSKDLLRAPPPLVLTPPPVILLLPRPSLLLVLDFGAGAALSSKLALPGSLPIELEVEDFPTLPNLAGSAPLGAVSLVDSVTLLMILWYSIVSL
jgi:hypothetical protein